MESKNPPVSQINCETCETYWYNDDDDDTGSNKFYNLSGVNDQPKFQECNLKKTIKKEHEKVQFQIFFINSETKNKNLEMIS